MTPRRVFENFKHWVKSFASIWTWDEYPPWDVLTDHESGSKYVILTTTVLNKTLPNDSMAERLEAVTDVLGVKYRVLVRSISNGALSVIPLSLFNKRKATGRYTVKRATQKESETFFDEEPKIRQMTMEGGSLNMSLSGLGAGIMARSFGEMFMTAEAPNYIECRFFAPVIEGFLVVTIQREKGKTPHQLREEAEAKVRELEAKLGVA